MAPTCRPAASCCCCPAVVHEPVQHQRAERPTPRRTVRHVCDRALTPRGTGATGRGPLRGLRPGGKRKPGACAVFIGSKDFLPRWRDIGKLEGYRSLASSRVLRGGRPDAVEVTLQVIGDRESGTEDDSVCHGRGGRLPATSHGSRRPDSAGQPCRTSGAGRGAASDAGRGAASVAFCGGFARRDRIRQNVNAAPPANAATTQGHRRDCRPCRTRSRCRRVLSTAGSPSK